jgi:hypothetical protein
LRPYRYSEESISAENIYRGEVLWDYIYIYPDGLTADVTYADGTEETGVDVSTLGIDMTGVECGLKYKRNKDGSVEILEQAIVVETDAVPHENYNGTSGQAAPIENKIEDTFGDDDYVVTESQQIDDYGDVDTDIFGY